MDAGFFIGCRMKFKKLREDAYTPTKGHTFDAGWDLRAVETVVLVQGTRTLVKTGIALDIPQGHVGMIWPRSGLANEWGLDILGGVIDSGYHGEVGVLVINHGEYVKQIKAGDKIAQLVLQEHLLCQMVEVAEFAGESSRGDAGFGSTGA